MLTADALVIYSSLVQVSVILVSLMVQTQRLECNVQNVSRTLNL